MPAAAKISSQQATGLNSTLRAKAKATLAGPRPNSFLTLVERTTELFAVDDDTPVEDVRRILLDVRQRFDAVHHEAEQKEAQLQRVREAIKVADLSQGHRAEENQHLQDVWHQLEARLDATKKEKAETDTRKKVYEHMLKRIQKEQAILKQKMRRMEQHHSRKKTECQQLITHCQRTTCQKVQDQIELEIKEHEALQEQKACDVALGAMDDALETRKEGIKRRAVFESWRHEVALEAATEAFNRSAGHLRKLYAVEKLAGNSLQKMTFEQVERSQVTEDGFQKIREVTGLTDVMDIVHKFLNRNVEREQLDDTKKDAEKELDRQRQIYINFKQETEGVLFDTSTDDRCGDIYKEVENKEAELNQALKDHELSRLNLQKTTLQTEHIKKWATRMGQLLLNEGGRQGFADPVRVDGPADLPSFFKQLRTALERFLQHVSKQISAGKVQRKAMSQVLSKEYHAQARLLESEQFLRANLRVPDKPDGRPQSRTGQPDDDATASLTTDRDKCKTDSLEFEARKAEQQKKRDRRG